MTVSPLAGLSGDCAPSCSVCCVIPQLYTPTRRRARCETGTRYRANIHAFQQSMLLDRKGVLLLPRVGFRGAVGGCPAPPRRSADRPRPPLRRLVYLGGSGTSGQPSENRRSSSRPAEPCGLFFRPGQILGRHLEQPVGKPGRSLNTPFERPISFRALRRRSTDSFSHTVVTVSATPQPFLRLDQVLGRHLEQPVGKPGRSLNTSLERPISFRALRRRSTDSFSHVVTVYTNKVTRAAAAKKPAAQVSFSAFHLLILPMSLLTTPCAMMSIRFRSSG